MSSPSIILSPAYHKSIEGTEFYWSGNLQQALDKFQESYLLSTDPIAAMDVGITLSRMGQMDESFTWLEQAYRSSPDDMRIRTAYGEGLFREGRWLEAWEHWFPVIENPFTTTAEQYDGQSLEGKEVLVVPAGGYGDVFMLSRYIPELQKYGCKVSFAPTSDMVPVFLKQPFMQDVNMTESRNWDIWMHLFHFPKLFQMTPDTVLWNGPYIAQMALPANTFRIGLKLGAGEKGDKYRFRSVPTADGEKFLNQNDHLDMVPLTIGGGMMNWLDTIAAISTCHLVISVDTSVLHLAAAMGKETWAILGDFTDPKWLKERCDSPWYPTMRLFRGNGKGYKHSLEQISIALNEKEQQCLDATI